ncbi:glycoside hydrolase family 19 protein [Kribbella deserti]|uniref:Glycoside hydrolase family 19 protein n=1 Tax=Kribbella deserti TaxID=1926257 RepID=A0ABV6QG15_9ACTN
MFGARVRRPELVAVGLPGLLAAMEQGQINTPRRVAAFLATLSHESYHEYNIREIGDTRTYGGRGYIQLTGVYNYTEAGEDLGVDLIADPDAAMSLQWSARIAVWYWTVARPRCNEYADTLQFGKICAAIGYPLGNGSEDTRRTDSFKSALRYLTGAVPDGITINRK